jgi:hypothetical protein
VIEHAGFWWIQDPALPFHRYLGNPLKRLGRDQYAVCAGEKALHWIDGRQVAASVKFVPSMAAQLTLGVWLPKWGGPAPWSVSTVSFKSVKVWQFDDSGDVRGVLTEDLKDNFNADGSSRK